MSDYGRIKKDSTFKNILVTAPNTYQKSDKEIITNFNEDEALMKEYGYKQVITTEPPYDENYEALTVESLTQDDENIYLTYGVNRVADPPFNVDLSNYYTKQEVYNKKEIDNMLENLKSDSITTEDLYAINGEIENLKSNFAQIDMAEINRLSTAYADIEELKSKLANIDTATIKNLTTDVGNIKLLLNGHLTSDNIQSLVLTASKVTVEDAFIKDAMIDSINANKINTGVLNTNKVNIQSDDGSMTLKGNLQQFKDKDGKVRIQIGKDATGEFTFSLFNAEGTGVLIDQNGIKSGAIGSGLIVDDMVSDDAHISGGKIDIDSLITNINGNTSTINSSKIKFDDTNQTLDVAFTALKTKVDSIEKITVDGDLSSVIKQVQSNTTNIKLQQGQISSLIDNTTITTENGKTIQLKDAYNSTVSTVDSLVNKIGSLETNVGSSLTNSETQFYTSTSSTALEGGEWITDKSPTWVSGKYIWQRVKYTYSNGGIKYSTPVCIQGAKGEKGDKGDQGLQGVPGEPGTDGKTYYTWIRYADTIDGSGISNEPTGKIYIGFAYNKETPTESNTPSDYTWTLIKGEKGDTGVQGVKGEDGVTYYTWIKYSDNADGTGLYDTPKDSTMYIGIAINKPTPNESSNKADYVWSRFKGDKGDQGLQGVPGKDGKTYYTWIKYADDDKGTGISDDPTGKPYIGLAYNKETSTESTNKTDYTWTLIKGEKGDTGIKGDTGADGTTYYTWIKYSDNADGSGLYDTPKDTTKYIGIGVNKTTPTESTNKADYTWSKFKGEQGVKGEDGITYYTWIKYADSVTGEGISNDPTGKTYIGLAYNKTTQIESDKPSDYIWSLIKGDKGDQGVQGVKGEDGVTHYTWIKYSDNADGTDLYDTPKDSTMYIGIAPNKTTATESNNKTDYIWSKFKGEKGDQGLQGVAGKDGKTYYTWIKYADDIDGTGISDDPTNKTYIGFAYNKTTADESTNKADYTWSLIKGEKGDQGVQGIKGTDGTTYYTWIKYSDNADGTDLYDTPKASTMYIGIAVNKTTQAESNNKTDYTWSRFKGEQGVKGENGKTYYTWIKYADDDKGNGISNEPTGKTYIGLAYNKTTQTESNTPSDYTWSLIKGEKGDQGVKGDTGADGTTYYTWIKYSDNADGTGLYDVPKDTTNYIGIAINKKTPTESNNKADYVWSKFKGDKGDKGDKGEQGEKGEQGSQGQQGEKGDTGQSMTSSTPQWYASDSATTQTGGTWSDTIPTLEVGKYYWMRYKQTWENPTKTTYTNPVLESLGEAIKEVKSQQSNLEHTLEGFKQTVSKDYAKQTTVTDLTNKLAKDYTTTSDMNSIIDQKVDGVLTTVGNTYATTSSVTDLNTKLEKNYYTSTQVNSKIDQKADSILSSVSDSYAEKTVVNDLANNLSSNYTTTTNMNSAIEQKATGILNTVSKTYTTKDELKELSFGGRNYLLDTKNAKTITGTKSANQCTNLYLLSDAKSSCNGEKITLSFTYKVSNYSGGDFIIQTYGGSSKGWSRITPSSDGTFTYKLTITAPINFDSATGVQIRMDAFVGTVEISNMMLEKGNTVSDWTPAPEDNASLIEDLGDYVLNITKETVIVSTDLSGNILS